MTVSIERPVVPVAKTVTAYDLNVGATTSPNGKALNQMTRLWILYLSFLCVSWQQSQESGSSQGQPQQAASAEPASATAPTGSLAHGNELLATRDSFDSAGTEIYYSVKGKGEPLFFLHGWLGSGRGLIEIRTAKTLANSYRVIAPDLRGHGNSDKPKGAEHYGKEMVEDVIRLMDHLEIEKAHFIGYSMGGMILTRLMVDHPSRVKSAVIGGTGGIRDYYDYKAVEVFSDAVNKGLPTGEALIECYPYTGEPPLDEELRQSVLALNKLDAHVMASVVKSWKQLEVSADELKRVQIPVLVLIGELDMPNNLRAAEELPKLIPGCEFFKFFGETHRSTLGLPDFVRRTEAFLSSPINR